MSAGDKATARPKTGSAFKVPGSRKVAKASTPMGDRAAALECNISAIPSHGCDLSTVRPGSTVAPRTGRQVMPAIKKALYQPGGISQEMSLQSPQCGGNKASKQMELDMAYNTYLLAVTHNTIQEKHYADTKAQIEADLGALSKRLAVNQLNLENTKQRIGKISFLSEQDRLLKAQRDAMTDTLDNMEGTMADRISAVGAALDEKTNHLELRNIATGTAELKKILADSSRILSQLRASNHVSDNEKVLSAANHLRNATDTMRSVNARYQRVTKKLPEYQATPIIEHAMKTFEAEQKEQETIKQEAEESAVISQT